MELVFIYSFELKQIFLYFLRLNKILEIHIFLDKKYLCTFLKEIFLYFFHESLFELIELPQKSEPKLALKIFITKINWTVFPQVPKIPSSTRIPIYPGSSLVPRFFRRCPRSLLVIALQKSFFFFVNPIPPRSVF